MKILTKLLTVTVMMILVACGKENSNVDSSVLMGKWKISATLADPGDGSGTWQPVSGKSNDYINFGENGQFSGNIFPEYKIYAVSDSGIITLKKADGVTYQNYSYELKDGSLSISPAGPVQCIEACGTRFKKIE